MTSRRPDSEDSAPHDDGSRLSRWSKRKAEARQDVATLEAKPDPVPERRPDTPSESDPELPVLTDADMPAIESLGEGSNFSQFMSSGVSDALRKRALSRLFKLPFFGVRDGLDDYDEDFRSFIPLGDTVTADMKFASARLEEKAREAREAPDGVSESDVRGLESARDEGAADVAPSAAPSAAKDQDGLPDPVGADTADRDGTDDTADMIHDQANDNDVGDAEDEYA